MQRCAINASNFMVLHCHSKQDIDLSVSVMTVTYTRVYLWEFLSTLYELPERDIGGSRKSE